MSFSGGGTLETGTLVSKFSIDASGAKATIDSINQNATQIKNAFGNVQIKIDGAAAKSALDSITSATVALKGAQAQSTTAIAEARTATASYTAALTQQRTATESVRTSTATTRDEIAKLSLAQKQAAQDAKDHTSAHGPLQNVLGGTNQLVQSLTMNMGGLGQGIQQATMAASGFSGPLLALGVGLAGVGLGLAASIKAAADWQTTLNQVSNNTQMTTADTAAMNAGVLQLSQTIPVATKALAEGWRFAADEGFNAADSFKVTAAGAEAAANTGANATDVINTLAKALHDYHIPASDAMLVTNMLVEGAKQGQTTFAAMSDSIGPLIAQAASMHVPLTDIVAAMSAMTQNGYPADQAVSGLTNLLKDMVAPSDKAKAAMEAMGPAGQKLLQDFTPLGLATNGLSGNIRDLTEATGGDAAKILEILPQLRGYRSGLVLAGSGADDFTLALQRQADVLSGKVTPTQEDFAKTMDTVGAKMQILRNTIQVLAIDLGTVFLPLVMQGTQWMLNFAQSIGLASGAKGFVDITQQIADVNKSFLDGKAAQDAYTQSQLAQQASTVASAAATTTATGAMQAHTDALANTKQAVVSLDEALGYPNGQKGIQAIIANLDTLEQSATGEAASAINSVNDALALPEGAIGPKDATKYLGELTNAGNDATQVVQGLNAELAANTVLLDQNAEAIQGVKDTYDPQIKTAEEQIAKINELSPDEQARKKREAELDVAKANLDLTKPDTSVYDNKILSDQTTLDNMPRLDTSTWDTNIANAQASLTTMQESDPAAGIKGEITDLQNAISGLNTDSFDEKINAIRDQLSQPAPDTHGITNQLTELNAQLADGTISQSQFDQQDGALSKQKQGINQAYTDSTSGLQGQLKLLERQRADQALANKETAQADRARIVDLTAQQKTIEAGHTKDMNDLKDYIKTQEAARTKATKDDAKARQDLQDDIKKEGNARTVALQPYTDALKKINDEQARSGLLDAAAAAQRKLDLVIPQATLDALKKSEADALAPLDLAKQNLDAANKKIQEQRTYWDGVKGAIDNAKSALDAYLKTPLPTSGAGGTGPGTVGYGKGILSGGYSPYDEAQVPGAPTPIDVSGVNTFDEFGQPYSAVPDSPLLTQMKGLKKWLDENIPSILDKLKIEAKLDLAAFMDGANFVKSAAQLVSDVYEGNWGALKADISALGSTLGGPASAPLLGPPAPPNMTNPATDILNGPRVGQTGTAYTQGVNGNEIIDAGRKVKDWLFGGFGGGDSRVQGADLSGQIQNVDDFVQHIQDQLGDNGGAQEAIQSFKDQIVKEMGDGSDAATAVQDAEKTFTDKFGDGGSVPAALTQTGDATKSALGGGGTVPTILQLLRDNHVPLTVAGLLKAFGQGGDAPTAITGTGDQATKTFGDGGTFDQATRSAVGTSQSAFGQGGFIDQHLGNTDRTITGTLGTGGSGQSAMTSFDTHTSGIFGGDGTIIGYFTSVVRWLGGDWQGLGTAIAKPFTDAQAPIQNWFTWLGGGINWLAEHFKLPSITPYGGGTSSGATGGGGPAGNGTLPGAANGLGGGMPGHWSMIGEKGPEAMYVPAGATIIPNHMLPGHADGLNIGGVFDALLASRGGNLQGTAGAFSDTLAANLGAPTLPGVDGGGAALTDAVRGGVFDWLKGSGVNLGPLAGRSGGGSALAIVNAVKSVSDDPDIWLAMLMAVASEQRTLSGPFVDQIGGGPGRGPFQIEAGPGGSNYGMISEDDARDPTKAAQYMVGRFLNAKRGPWGADNETAGAMTAAAAEVGAAFLAGNVLGYDRSVVDASYAMATQALAASSQAAGPSLGGGFMQPVVGPITQPWGQTGFYLESGGFHDGVDFGVPIGTQVVADASGTVDAAGWTDSGYGNWVHILTDNFATWTGHMSDVLASVGDTVQKGQIVGYSGNTGASTGPHVHWGAHRDGQSIDPFTLPGLADGGVTYGGNPHLVTVGDGPPGEPEWHVPEPDLTRLLAGVVRRESGGGGATVTFAANSVVVHAAPGMDEGRVAALVLDGIHEVFVNGPHQRGR